MLKGPLQSGTLKTSKKWIFLHFSEHKNVFVGLLYDGYKQAFETKTMISMNSKRDIEQKGENDLYYYSTKTRNHNKSFLYPKIQPSDLATKT